MSVENMIQVDNLTKYYGPFPAITDVSFKVARGEVLGFLGPNAAGKTTTMRILTGFIPPSSGAAYIGGYDVVSESLEARKQIGYLPESVPLYTDMTVKSYLNFMGTVRRMNPKDINRRISDVVDICHLEEYYNSLIGKLSKGFRQRVGIAQAILHEPEVLILDEPTVGIDPIQVVETRQLIKSLGGDHTLILSTHILPEVSMICERVVIIHEGEIVAEDRPENLAKRMEGVERVLVEIAGPNNKVTKALHGIPGVKDISYGSQKPDKVTYNIACEQGSDVRGDLARIVIEQGWGLLRLETIPMSLEEIFLKLTTSEDK